MVSRRESVDDLEPVLSQLLPSLPDRRAPAGRPRAWPRSCMLASMSAGLISRRGFLAVGLIGLLGTPAAAAGKPAVTVYKEPT